MPNRREFLQTTAAIAAATVCPASAVICPAAPAAPSFEIWIEPLARWIPLDIPLDEFDTSGYPLVYCLTIGCGGIRALHRAAEQGRITDDQAKTGCRWLIGRFEFGEQIMTSYLTPDLF